MGCGSHFLKLGDLVVLSSTVSPAVSSMWPLRHGYGVRWFHVSNGPTMPRLMRRRQASQTALCAASTRISPFGPSSRAMRSSRARWCSACCRRRSAQSCSDLRFGGRAVLREDGMARALLAMAQATLQTRRVAGEPGPRRGPYHRRNRTTGSARTGIVVTRIRYAFA
jgi:hypothetical protein